jgi:histone-lysine N-methyltransferase SETMAR
MENPGPHTANRPYDWLRRYGWEVVDHPAYTPGLIPSDFHPFGLLEKHLAGKRFAADADVRQAVVSCLQTLDTFRLLRHTIFGATGQALRRR